MKHNNMVASYNSR